MFALNKKLLFLRKAVFFDINDFLKNKNEYTMTIIVSGQNEHYQLLVESNSKNENNIPCVCPPLPINSLDWHNLRSFSIGQFHTVIVTNEGELLCIGDDNKYQIGSNERKLYDKVTKFSLSGYEDRKFKLAQCGKNYTLYLTEGNNDMKEEVLICCNKSPNFKPIKFNYGENNIKILKTGKTRVGIVDDKDNLYLIEKKEIDIAENEGENIISIDAKRINHPIKNGIKDICICETFICILSEDGIVYGNEEMNKNRKNFVQISFPPQSHSKIAKIVGTHFHCIAITEDKNAYVFSYNGSGQLGLGHKEDTNKFVEIPFFIQNKIKIIDAATSGFHSLFLSDDQKIFSCGNNFNGQLLKNNLEEKEDNLIPQEISFHDIKFTKVHSLLCSEWGSAIFVE